ncbi:MAG: nucleotidyltransferase family protein [Pirellulaceae bacterium]|nr:nucleotidyltransferase family protein [Pirellulaceae bacterium]
MSNFISDDQRPTFAIVPAAGRSRRMGQSKLLLPWRGTTVIEHVIEAWLRSRVTQVVVVARRDDLELTRRVARQPVVLVTPEQDPLDMKASIQHGIEYLTRTANPRASDGCFIAPADLPRLSAAVIDRLIDARAALSDSMCPVVLPYFGGQRGHPGLLPWSLLMQVPKLSDRQGVNALVDQHSQFNVLFDFGEYIGDIDTMEDYQRLLDEETRGSS